MRIVLGLLGLALSCSGCALSRPDHFYVLSAQPPASRDYRATFSKQIVLRVELPALVDRSELVVNSPSGVLILEHERWAAPLSDQIKNVLGQDLEQRRADALINAQRTTLPGTAAVAISVDVVQLTAVKDRDVSLEARWRVEDISTSTVTIGRATFTALMHGTEFAGIAQAVSECTAQLADRLASTLGPETLP